MFAIILKSNIMKKVVLLIVTTLVLTNCLKRDIHNTSAIPEDEYQIEQYERFLNTHSLLTDSKYSYYLGKIPISREMLSTINPMNIASISMIKKDRAKDVDTSDDSSVIFIIQLKEDLLRKHAL
jgi:hypothetical protein